MRSPKFHSLPDLTALADVAWLLLVFFFLSGRMKQADAHPVDLPTSPHQDLHHWQGFSITFKVEANGRLWITLPQYLKLSFKDKLQANGQKLDPRHEFQFWAEDDIDFGPGFMVLSPEKTTQWGDHVENWLDLLGEEKPKCKMIIRADQNVPYEAVDRVLLALSARKFYRVNLITNLENDPLASI